jgi:nucleoside-diphosphate-sugar epimerase
MKTKSILILIASANGLVGRHLLSVFVDRGMTSQVIKRSEKIYTNTPYQSLIHLAGRAHIMNDTASDPLAEFRAANCDYALQVAKQACAAGVKRFIYMSSIGVNRLLKYPPNRSTAQAV